MDDKVFDYIVQILTKKRNFTKEESVVYEYLVNDKSNVENEALHIIGRLLTHPKILSELAYWVENRSFPKTDVTSIRGYTAEAIFKKCPVSEVGAYTTLAWLRDDPQRALEFITDDMPIL